MRKLNALLVLCFALFFASTVQGQTNTGANNAELNGNYAFSFNGPILREEHVWAPRSWNSLGLRGTVA